MTSIETIRESLFENINNIILNYIINRYKNYRSIFSNSYIYDFLTENKNLIGNIIENIIKEYDNKDQLEELESIKNTELNEYIFNCKNLSNKINQFINQ